VATSLGQRGLAFLCVRESPHGHRLGPSLKKAFGGTYVTNEAFTPETAEQALQSGEADAIAWGKMFIANPDLPRRLSLRAPLNPPDSATFYGTGPKGYTDYPALQL